jgi:hypothetical protein
MLDYKVLWFIGCLVVPFLFMHISLGRVSEYLKIAHRQVWDRLYTLHGPMAFVNYLGFAFSEEPASLNDPKLNHLAKISRYAVGSFLAFAVIFFVGVGQLK